MNVARAYAKALLEAAKDKGQHGATVDAIESDLRAVAEAVSSSKESRIALMSPATSAKEKEQIAVAIADKVGCSSLTKQFLQLIARKERFSEIADIATAFTEVRLAAEGGCMGSVISAQPISESDLSDLSASFGKKLGKKVSFHTAVDSDLLAGVKVTIGGVTYDGSLRSQLNQLRDRLMMSTEMVH